MAENVLLDSNVRYGNRGGAGQGRTVRETKLCILAFEGRVVLLDGMCGREESGAGAGAGLFLCSRQASASVSPDLWLVGRISCLVDDCQDAHDNPSRDETHTDSDVIAWSIDSDVHMFTVTGFMIYAYVPVGYSPNR